MADLWKKKHFFVKIKCQDVKNTVHIKKHRAKKRQQ